MTFGSALLHLLYIAPRVEALRTSTLGWGNATPTELPGVRTFFYGLTIHGRWEHTIHIGLTIHGRWVRTFHIGLTIHGRWVHSIHIGLYYPHAYCIVFGTGEEDLGKPPYTFPIHRDDGNNL